MSGLKRINRFRRKLMKRITEGVGHTETSEKEIDKDTAKKILITRPNHRLGNLLLITPLVQEVTRIFPNSTIDLFVKGGIAPTVFKNYKTVNRIIQLPKKHFHQPLEYAQAWLKLRTTHYDLVINAEQDSSSGKLSTKFARSRFKFFGEDQQHLETSYDDYQHLAKKSIYNLRHYLSQRGVNVENTDIPPLDLKLTADELAEGRKLLKNLIPKEGKTICLFTYATGAKCYSEHWWLTFHKKLKEKYSDYNILEILPIENVSQIRFREPSFYSKNIREMASVIATADIFIGSDSGIMHLASASQTPTIGFFIKDVEKYKAYHKNSLGINTNNRSIDEIFNLIDPVFSKIYQSGATIIKGQEI